MFARAIIAVGAVLRWAWIDSVCVHVRAVLFCFFFCVTVSIAVSKVVRRVVLCHVHLEGPHLGCFHVFF